MSIKLSDARRCSKYRKTIRDEIAVCEGIPPAKKKTKQDATREESVDLESHSTTREAVQAPKSSRDGHSKTKAADTAATASTNGSRAQDSDSPKVKLNLRFDGRAHHCWRNGGSMSPPDEPQVILNKRPKPRVPGNAVIVGSIKEIRMHTGCAGSLTMEGKHIVVSQNFVGVGAGCVGNPFEYSVEGNVLHLRHGVASFSPAWTGTSRIPAKEMYILPGQVVITLDKTTGERSMMLSEDYAVFWSPRKDGDSESSFNCAYDMMENGRIRNGFDGSKIYHKWMQVDLDAPIVPTEKAVSHLRVKTRSTKRPKLVFDNTKDALGMTHNRGYEIAEEVWNS